LTIFAFYLEYSPLKFIVIIDISEFRYLFYAFLPFFLPSSVPPSLPSFLLLSLPSFLPSSVPPSLLSFPAFLFLII
jgi:hypothetical protein